MQIEMVSANLDAITNPILIKSPNIGAFRLMDMRDHTAPQRVLRIKRMGIAKGGNVKNARWRNPRGGSYCSPINSHLVKNKNAR